MVQPRTMDFIGELEITEVETIFIYNIGFATIVIENSMTEVGPVKEMLQITDIMLVQYAASQDIMSNNAICHVSVSTFGSAY